MAQSHRMACLLEPIGANLRASGVVVFALLFDYLHLLPYPSLHKTIILIFHCKYKCALPTAFLSETTCLPLGIKTSVVSTWSRRKPSY